MNKLFTKIAALALGATMAVGVGVAVGNNKVAIPVHAAVGSNSKTVTMTSNSVTNDGITWSLNNTSEYASSNTYIRFGGGSYIQNETPISVDKAYQVQFEVTTRKYGGPSANQIVLTLDVVNSSGNSLTTGSVTVSPGSTSLVKKTSSALSFSNASGSDDAFFRIQSSAAATASKCAGVSVITVKYQAAATKTLSKIELGGTYSTDFFTGDSFNHNGMTVTATYEGGSTSDVTSKATWSSPDMSTSGSKKVTVSYTEGQTTKTADYNITVTDRLLSQITLSGQTTSYSKGAAFSFDGECTASYSNAPDKVVTPTSVSSPDMTTVGTKKVTVSYTEGQTTKTADYYITVNKAPKPGTVVYTLDGTITGTGSAYAGGHDTEQSSITWNITGNIEQSPWRIGGKSITAVDREIYSKQSIDSAVACIDLELGSSSGLSVNSITLVVASDDSFENVIDEIDVDVSLQSTTNIYPDSVTIWPEDSFYKFVINVTNASSSNGYVQFVGATFKGSASYSAEIQGPNTVNSGSQWASTGVLDEDQDQVPNVTFSFSAVGAIITASDPTGTFTATGSGTVTVSATAGDMYSISSKQVTVLGDEPTIVPEKVSTSGYTGQDETISFTYSNLNDELSVVSDNTSIVTVSNLSYDDGSGSVDFHYVAPGNNVDVKFKDGDDVLATVKVSVEQITVTISKASTNIERGQTDLLTASTNFGTINWECDCLTGDITVTKDVQNPENATVSVSASAVIGSTAKVTAYCTEYPSAKAICTVTVIRETMTYKVGTEESWVLVTDASVLADGDIIIITNADSEVGMLPYVSGDNNIKVTDITAADGKLTDIGEAAPLTLSDAGSGNFYLNDGTYYLYAAASDKNQLKGKNSTDSSNGAWNFTYETDHMSIVASGSSNRNVMQYNAGNNPPIISCYASASQTNLQVYKKLGGVEVITVTDDLYNAVHNNFGESESGATYTWDATCSSFNMFNWTSAGNNVKGITDFSSYKLNIAIANSEGNEIEQFIAKYDNVVSKFYKYCKTDEEKANLDFLSRVSSGKVTPASKGITVFIDTKNTNTIAIVVIVSVVSLTAIGGYFFLRKRREQN